MSNVYYLDTNICIFLFRQKKDSIIEEKIRAQEPENVKIPAIVKAELLVGAMKSSRMDENIQQVVDFCDSFEIVPFDDNTSWCYGKMKSALERKGQLIGYNDMVIAAIVLANDGILITNNTRKFSRIDGLKLEDWTQE